MLLSTQRVQWPEVLISIKWQDTCLSAYYSLPLATAEFITFVTDLSGITQGQVCYVMHQGARTNDFGVPLRVIGLAEQDLLTQGAILQPGSLHTERYRSCRCGYQSGCYDYLAKDGLQ